MKSVSSLLQRPKGLRVQLLHVKALTLVALITILSMGTSTVQGASLGNAPDGPDGPPTGWTITTVDSLPTFSNMTNSSMDHTWGGVPCLAYGGEVLYYSCYVNGFWVREIVDTSLNVGEYASLAFSPVSGYPYISYYDAANARLKMAYKDLIGWHVEIVDDPPPSAPDSPPEDEARSSEEQLRDLLKPWLAPLYRQHSPDTPAFLAADLVGVGKYSAITVDRLGRVHISYYDEDNGKLKHATWDTHPASPWIIHVVDDSQDNGKWTSIVVDSNDRVHISYMSEHVDALMYAKGREPFGTGYWKKTQLALSGSQGAFTSIALDDEDDPHIAYFDWGKNDLVHFEYKSSTENWVAKRVDEDGSVGWYSSLMIVDDKLYISYYDKTDERVRLASRKMNQSDWNIEGAGAATVVYFTSIDWSPSSTPAIAFYDAHKGELTYKYEGSNNKWKALYPVDFSGDVGLSSSLDLNSQGVPFISYYDVSQGFMKYARGIASSIFYKNYVTRYLLAGAFSSLKLMDEQRARIAFFEGDDETAWETLDSGAFWGFSEVDDSAKVGEFISMDLDSAKLPHMSYYDSTNRDLRYATWSVALNDWKSEKLDHLGEDVGLYTSIAVDSSNNLHISYYDDTYNALKYISKLSGGGWSYALIVDGSAPADEVGLFTSIALDNLQRPHISYYDFVNNRLKYAHYDPAYPLNNGWLVEVLDSAGAVGLYTSLAIDQTDNSRHICYYDETNGNLKYIQWTGAWEAPLTIDDDVGDVGKTCSIALAPGNNVAISYYDYSHGDLKLAHNYTLPNSELIFLPIILNK